ncbi:MAG: ATP-binding protein [Acidimicrobiia bacterium]
MEFERGRFYLGGVIDPATGERTDEPVVYDSADLTTHGVIVGMTGSGKTGLGIGLIEEALASQIPCLVIDPKGDMGNLMLNFPDFAPSDFAPWVDPGAAKQAGTTVDELAIKTAADWKNGLESWGISADAMRRLAADERVTIYTPGSSAGVGLDILGSLQAPGVDFDSEAETLRDEIEGYVSSLLMLAGVESDPVSGSEHILIATIIESAWRGGSDLDLAGLIGQIMKPPFRKLGVFEIDTFFPEKDRTALAMRLNGLAASPSFASWMEGEPLDIAALLHRDGTPQVAVVYLSHLSDAERQFVVTLLLSKVVTWMRSQSGSSELRALVYMDEVFGFAPPTAEPPSKKPILTILKQARAFGVGMVLSTQNPVDLDYKAMSNAGTWMIGRLQTERDKARILEGLQSASGSVDVASFDALISGLGKRQFVLQSAKANRPAVFTTRWAMSYLAGPLTRDQVQRLSGGKAPTAQVIPPSAPASSPADPTPAGTITPNGPASDPAPPGTIPQSSDPDATPVAPKVAEGLTVAYLDPAADWRATIPAPSGTLCAAAVATVHLLYDDTKAGVEHRETFEAVIHPLGPMVDASNLHVVDHDPRDFRPEPPTGATYRLSDAPIGTKTYWTGLERSLADHLVRERRVTVWRAVGLKLYSRVGETEAEFNARCQAAAEDAADADMAKLKTTYAARIDRVRDQISTAERRVSELEADVSSRRQSEVMSGAGDLLGALLGGRRRSSSISQAASRRSQTKRTEERLDTAIDAMQAKAADLLELEDELETAVLAIEDKWNSAAQTIEPIEIPLEKSDVNVAPLMLIWI